MSEIIDYNEQDTLPVLESISAWPIAQKYAIYSVCISIFHGILPLVIDGLLGNRLFQFSGMIPIIAIFYFCFKEHKTNDLNGFLPFGRILRLSLYIGLISTPIIALWIFVLYKFIAPGLLDAIIEATRKAVEEKIPDNPDQVEGIMSFYTKWIFTPSSMTFFALFSTVPTHLFFGCLVGLFQRKELK
ncbi:MAG: hypothetical protein RI894_790 [Bacteroidota bacterium]|jgi:hypothetical protein